MIQKILIVGTGLIGASIGLALKRAGFDGEILGYDSNPQELSSALAIGALDGGFDPVHNPFHEPDVIVLCVPVLAILNWMEKLLPLLGPHQLITDVGSTKLAITQAADRLFPDGGHNPLFLPGHPMAGKESGGAALADAALFDGAMWLFTSTYEGRSRHEVEWRELVMKFGCRTLDLDAARHDQICAWVSHLPQMVATAMSAMFDDEFAQAPELADDFAAIGGRALREMTRLGASPYSMWRDVAFTNTKPLGATLFALEQRLAHMRENLKTPELREEFEKANDFRRKR
jgi:prephenate dehydrogenase